MYLTTIFDFIITCLYCLFISTFPSSANENIHNSTGQQDILISRTQPSDICFPAAGVAGWKIAPTSLVTRTYPKLVNYHHMSLSDGKVSNKEERLAQWDIIILNPDLVDNEKLSLLKIRRTNPRIKILAWIPFGQEPVGMALANGIPREGTSDWFCRYPDGKYIRPSWGGHFMNPYIANNAWPKFVANFVSRHYVKPGDYDGVLMDIMAESNWMGADLNRDGRCDKQDKDLWQKGINVAVTGLRTDFPQAIISGNGGSPWSEQCPYFEQANGNMHENALGDQFGVPGWDNLWQGYKTCMTQVKAPPKVHFISVDLRNGRSLQEAQKLSTLTQEDLRRMRLGLGTTLLEDGYFGFDRGDCLHGQLWWFDEYDANLGQPLRNFEKDLHAPGTYSREFQNGLVIVNPSKSAFTVSLKEAFKDATTGQVGHTFIVPVQDAKILIRLSATR